MTPSRDEAWAAAIKALGNRHATNAHFLKEAVYNAHLGWRSTAWNNAIQAGIPVDELRPVYELLYG